MKVKECAYAKVNLFLDVVGRRNDGYHDIYSLMHSVSLHDTLIFASSPCEEQVINISSDDNSLETGEGNLIYKAAKMYMSKFDINAKIDVNLIKRIPIGAGLGGGSSDAAATLRAMNRIFGTATNDELLSIASKLGSDVAFCLNGNSAICSGKGEVLESMGVKIPIHAVVAIGESRVSTPKAYSMLDDKYGDFIKYNEEKNLPDIGCKPIFYNIFENVIKIDEIDSIKKIMLECGAENTLMSGSGPSVFAVFNNAFSALRAKRRLKKHGFSAYKCKFIRGKI